ncbi:MAG TPA: hypothetical protein VFA49_13220, partial [Chloroflexota bacterium]|nr:hypothetical protein [Chloroflexota bacterium]
MAYRRPAPETQPGSRLPWVALGLGVLVLAVAAAFFLLNRPRTVNITVEATPTVNPVARGQTVQAGPPPTFTPPPAVLQPTATPPPTPTRVPVATQAGFVPAGGSPAPAAGQPPAAPSGQGQAPAGQPSPAAQSAPAEQPGQAAQPGQSAPVPAGQPAPAAPPGGQPPAPTGQPPPAATPPSPTATPFTGQVANPGGLGNTRADFDAALGPPIGETPDKLVAYRRGNIEFHVGYTPEPVRAWIEVELVPQGTQMPLDQGMAEARKLFPRDAQPRAGNPEGNDQFVLERFGSQTLAQAI